MARRELDRRNLAAVALVRDAMLQAPCPRIVTIWGAGTSIRSGVAGGFYMKERMRRELIKLVDTQKFKKAFGDKAAEEKERLKSDGAMPFEDVMGIYAALYDTRELHGWLAQYIRPRSLSTSAARSAPPCFPTFTHEYCAHLANAGYLKYFISLNFDEILESTLQDELGSDAVRVIGSRSEFGRLLGRSLNSWEVEYAPRAPRCYVLKPHGTITRGLSMRHTPEQVCVLEDEKREVLRECLRDALPVLLGFGNYNEDLWLLFGESYCQGLTRDVVVVNPDPKAGAHPMLRSSSTRQVHHYCGTADQFFFKLASALQVSGTYGTARQKPTRHAIRSLFFDVFSRQLVTEADEAAYRRTHRALEAFRQRWFNRRLYELELLIYLFKSRGLFVPLATARCARIEQAYRRCYEDQPDADLRPAQILGQLLNNREPALVEKCDLRDRFDRPALQTEWLFLLLPELVRGKRRPTYSSLGLRFRRLCVEAARRYQEHLVTEGRAVDRRQWSVVWTPRVARRFASRLAGLLEELFKDFDVDVSDSDLSSAMRFACPTIVRSRIELHEQTATLLREPWETLRVATVSAEWLANFIAGKKLRVRERRIVVVSNLDMFVLPPRDGRAWEMEQVFHHLQMLRSIAKLITAISRWPGTTVDWYGVRNLEHHMVVASRGGPSSKEDVPLRAVYFRRMGKSTSISPVVLTGEAAVPDMKALMGYFDDRVEASRGTWVTKTGPSSGRLFTLTVRSSRPRVFMATKLTRMRELLKKLLPVPDEEMRW